MSPVLPRYVLHCACHLRVGHNHTQLLVFQNNQNVRESVSGVNPFCYLIKMDRLAHRIVPWAVSLGSRSTNLPTG